MEIAGIPSGEFAASLDRALVGGTTHQVDGEVSDDGHVFRAMAGPQAGLIFVELDIEHPMELVFDPPVAAHGASESLGVERGGGDIEAPVGRGLASLLASLLDGTFDHADGLQVGKARFAGVVGALRDAA